MDMNFSAIDVLYDSNFLNELEEKFGHYRNRTTSRGRQGSQHYDWSTARCGNDGAELRPSLGQLSTGLSVAHRSPSTDFDVSHFVYSFLKTQFLATTSRSSLSEGLINKKIPSLEKILESRWKPGQLKNSIPLQQQIELALLWRTINIFLGADDISLAIDFFREFLSTMEKFPPLSLSTQWKSTNQSCSVDVLERGIPNQSVCKKSKSGGDDEEEIKNIEDDIPLLPIPELAYLNVNIDGRDQPRVDDMDGPIKTLPSHHDDLSSRSERDPQESATMAANLVDHDPLGVIQKLFDVTECLALAIPPCDRHVLLSVGLAIGTKAGRAALILAAASVLASSESVLNDTDIDIKVLKDMKTFVENKKARKSTRNDEGISPKGDNENISTIRAKKTCIAEGSPRSSNQSGTSNAYDLLKESILSSNYSSGGLVMSFGKADHGKLGHGDSQVHRAIPTVVESMKQCSIVKIASMSTYSVVVDNSGGVFVWGTGGSSGSMQGLRTDILPQPLEALVEKAPIISVACGLGHALFLLANGKVCAWGNGGNGRLGLGDTTDRAEACLIKDLVGEVIGSVQCGASHSMAITKKNGNVYIWGKNSQGQCGKGNLEDIQRPSFNATLQSETVVKMAAGWEHTIALTSNGLLYAWGSGYKDSRRGLVPPVLGLGHAEGRSLPELVVSIKDIRIIDIASGWDHCLALDSKNRVYSWGSGQNGKLGHNSEENVTAPCIIPTLDNVEVVQISAGCEHSGAITAAGELFTWGHGDGGRLGHGDSEARIVPTKVEALLQMHARPLTLHCGDKFTMIAVEAQTAERYSTKNLSDNSKVEEEPECNVFSMSWLHSIVDQHITSFKNLENPDKNVVCPGDLTLSELEKLGQNLDMDVEVEADSDTSSLISSEDSPDGITGKDVLLGVLSLMARSFDDDIFRNKKTLHHNTILVNEKPGDSGVDIKPCLSYKYSVEISVQLFQSLLVILTLQSEELFEAEDMLEGEHTENDENGEHQQNDKHQHYDGDDVPNLKISCLAVDEVWAPTGVLHTKDKENDQSTTSNVKLPKSFLNWAILRCALAVLHSNLFVLNDICAQDNKGDVALKGLLSRHVSKAENKFTDNNNSLNEFMSSADEVPKGSFSASGRLASLLGVTSMSNLDEYDGLRSSDDEDDDDEEEDEEDDEDDEDEEDEDDDENASEDDEDEDCEDDDAGHMADMLDHLHDEGFEDDDMDNSKELLDEEVAKLAHAVMSLMEEEEQDHDHDIDQEEHDVSYGEEYDLGNDLYDNDNNEELDLDLEEGNNNIDVNTSTRNHQRSGGSNENELYQSTLGRQNFQDTEGGGGNNEREGNNSLHSCESNHHENDDSGYRNHNLDHDEGNDEVDKAICLSLSDAAKSHRDRNIIASGLDRHLSPAASQESLELSNRVAKSKSDDENSLKARSSNVIDDEKCHNGDQNSEIGEKHAELSERVEKPVAPIGEEEFYDDEDDEDYQRAVSASLEDQNSIDVIQLMLQSKHVFKTNEVLPLLGKQLEYISRLCFDGIKSSRSSSMPNVKHDTPALVEMWKDLQSTICMGFQTLYSVEEQKELISYSIKNTENWMHMVPCVSMALSKDEFLLTSISSSSASKPLVKKKSKNNLTEERFEIPSNDDKHSTVKHPNEHDLKHSIDVSHICHALRNLKKYDIASTHLIKSIFGEADEALPRHGKREMKSTIQPDSRVIENIFEKDLHYILIHSSLNTMRSFVSFFLIKHIAGPLGNAFAPESSVEIQKITELLETIVQVINAELQELAANIPKKVALRYQGSKRTSLHEADDAMISRILKNSVSSKLLTCLGGFFVCNNANIKNVALFMPYAMQLLHIYQQSNCAFSDSSARCQHVCDIGTLLQKWLLTEMRWIVLFVSSAINIFFTVNEDKNLGRFKHSTAISISTFNKISSSPLIDINTIMSSLQHKAWIDIDDTVKIWCSVFFSEVKAKYFPSQDANELSPHKVDFEGTKDDPWALLMKDFSTYFFNFSKSPINNYQQLAKFDFEYSKWFTDFSSFFSLYSINWMANFAPTFEDLVSLTGLDVRCLALLITLAVDDDSEGSYNSIPLILSMIEVSKTSANELLDTISANRGDNFSTFFKNWIKSLRLFLFALFCRCYEMHTEVEKLKVLAMTRNLDKHSSSFVDKVVEIWFLVLVVSGIMVQKMLISVCTEDTNDKMLTSRMMNVLFKSIELANTAVKAFDVRSQDIDLLMADASEAECARVTNGSRWLVEGVVMDEGHSPYSSDKGSINQGLFYFHKLSDMASSSHDRALNHHPVLQNVADIAVFLLADISVSALENICLISHICYRSTIYGVQLCTETFSLLRESDEALRYFSAALELPQIKMKAFRSLYLNYEIRRTSSIHTAEWEGINNAQQNNNLLLYKLPHLKKQSQVICSLDNCITEIFASISKKISSDSTAAFGSKSVSKAIVPSINNFEYLDLQAAMLFPKLIDTLQYGIRSAIEDSSFRFNYLSLASPLFGLSTLMNLLQSVCSDDKADRKDEYFWKLTKLLRQYLLSAHNLQLTINDLSDLPSAASSLPPISDNASLVNTERGLDTLKNCDHLMKIVENITAGLGDMRLEITKQCVATDTKVYLPQIRLLDYSSPVIIPNTSTDFGNYSIGFWIKIPKGYKETSKENDNQGESLPLLSPRSNLQANSTQKRSTHILSRVPEAGEVDMFNLFKGVPTTLCNPGIILEVLPDGSALLVVTVTSTVDSDGRKNPSKKIRMVKLSSKPLPFDTWIDISLQYTCLFNERNAMTSDENIGNSKSRGEKMRSDGPNGDKRFTERSIVHLFVDGELHATAIDSFGRLSLHQNIVFGTTPVSLIKPNNQHECLQAGGVRWSAQTSYKAVDSDKTGADVDCSDSNISTLLPLNNSYPSGMSAMITINELRPSSAPLQIKMLYEPFVCVQSIQKDLSDIAQFSLKIAADFFMVHTKETLLRLHASLEYSQSNDPPHVNTTFNILTPKPQNSSAEKALGYLETLVTLLPSIGYRAVCLLGDCSYCDSLQESIFHYLNVNIDVLVSVKSCMDANARQLSSMGAKLRSVIQTASSALQQQTSFLLSIVEILVKNDCSKKPEQDTDDVFASSFPTTSSSSDNATTNSFGSSGTMGDVSSLLQYWLNRLHDSKQLREEKIYPTEMISAWILSKGYNNQKQNENGLVTNIASIVAKAVNSDLISISKIMSPVTNSFTGSGTGSVGLSGSGGGTQSTTSVHMLLVGFFAGGGWPVAIQSNSIVELYPRALFLHQDPKCLEHAVFPATARVRSASPIGGVTAGATVAGSAGGGMSLRPSGVWLHQCDGLFNRHRLPLLQNSLLGLGGKEPKVHFPSISSSSNEQDDGAILSRGKSTFLDYTSIVPRQQHLLIQSTEMVSARDAYVPLSLPNVAHVMNLTSMGNASSLLALLQRLSRLSSSVFTSSLSNKSNQVLPTKGIQLAPMEKPHTSVLEAALGGSKSIHDPPLSTSNVNETEEGGDNPALELTMCMSHIRSLLVQLATVECLQGDEKMNHLTLLQNILERDLHSLISIALLDPVNSVVQAFHKATAEQQQADGAGDHTSTGQQLDVLSNLLREGDICFLEKISLRVWRHFHNGDNTSKTNSGDAKHGKSGHSLSPRLQPAPISGEVQILGNRIRALSHFPSVKIYPVNLEKMSGRWFYECTLLSDGLMQIGWADRAFRSDPVCGQGVGDHLHSWAVDGLRTKKWNVSCEPYGTRWKVEDVIGVLVDMDLLEMKFFINGVDLGPAFINFQATGLYPAISLNVRQCLRVNYGQELFMFPPDVVDKLPYRPVQDAVNWKSPTKKASKNVEKIQRNTISTPSESVDVEQVERITIVQSESANPGHISARVGSAVPGRRLSRGNVHEPSRGNNSSSSEEEAARHAAMVVSAAHAQQAGLTSGVGGGAMNDSALEESVDERQIREGVHTENSEVSTEANAWAEMGQNLSRRGSRIGLSPRANVSASTDGGGISGAAQRLLQLAAAGGEESMQKDGSDENEDEKDDDKDDDDDNDDNDQAVMRFFQQQQRHEHRAEVRGTSTEVEARRQQLIENLIGMGFPIDWSLRAAEHCDANVSESVAIAWIIERMELEHAKMEEMDGGEDSRMAEEMEEGDENHMEDEPNARSIAGQQRTNFGFHGQGSASSHIDDNNDSKESNSNASNSNLNGSGTKPVPKPPVGTRGGGGAGAGGGPAGAYSRSSKVNQLNHDIFTGSACSTGGYQDQGTWNNEDLSYATILVGHESARRRFDMDKQAVLSQISELDFCDLFPIVLSCQFSLCIFYARCAFIRIIRMICGILRKRSPCDGNSTLEESVDCGVQLHALGENFLKLLLEKPSDSTCSNSTALSSLVNLLEICFKQGQGASHQPDKLFPSLLKGTTAGDPIDTCPTVAPFTSHNSRSMTETLSMLELAVFAYYEDSRMGYRAPKVISTIAMEESSLQSSSVMMSFLDLITERSFRYNTSIPSNFTYKAQGSRCSPVKLVASLSGTSNVDELGIVSKSVCCEFLKYILSTSLLSFEMVTDEVYERKDWISSGSERSIQEPLQKNEKISIFEDVSHKPYIFWSFMAMKSIFKTSRKFELANPLEFVADSLRRLHLPDTSQYDPVEELSSPAMIARLFKIANRSANTSLNYCLFSICNDAFNRLNRKMTTVNAVLQDPHAQFMLQVVTDSELSTGSLHIAPLLRQWEKQLFHEANGYHDALTLMTYPSMSKNKPPNCTFQQFPNHPLGGFTPEYKVLRICSAKLLTESAHYRLNSRYTRELFQFLLEVNTLQGLVLAFSKKMNYNIPLNLLHEDIVNDWRVASESNLMPNLPGKSSELPVKAESMDHNPDDHQDNDESPLTLLKDSKKSSSFLRSAQATSSINTATLSSTNLTKGRLPIPTISVTHVTSTSLVVSWANIPEDEDWNSAVQRAAVAASSSAPANVPVVAGANTTSTGISLSASVGGLLASIKGTLSNSQPNHTSYSLYITPIYRTLSLSCSGIALPEQSTDIKALRNAAEPSLVMPFVTPSGSHKIDLLDPDTLYRVSLVSDEDGTSFIVTPPESLSKQPSNKSFTTWGTNLLRGKKDSNNPATLLSTTGPVKVSSSLDDVKSFKTINSSKSNIDDNMVDNLSKETIQPSDGKDKDEKGKPASLLSERTSCTDPFEKQIATMVSTVTEPLILLDGAVGLCPPQLKVTHHGLTVRNTINKKWSTVRSTSRLTTGVHQWEIFIDRCISKNIFIGVVGPEARTDNYVGCDKHGWAFLANRAVWFNKGKLKSYGELFRTGDVVQVTLDLDVGGSLSFSINGKDLGVAVEGLTGPLYPAFSLYNENDKISLSPPRQPQFVCSMDRCVDDSNLEATLAKMVYDTEGLNESRTGNSGTSNAERVVQRLDVVQSLYRFIVAGNVYRGAAAAKSSIPIFMPKTFLTPPLLTELTLKWSLWRQNVTLRTVRVQNGEIITIMVSSLQTLGMSDNRYCPGDLVQWEQHQFVVLGVGRHRLWFQKTSGNGDVIGFTKEFLHALHVKNSIRLVKKRSTLHRARAEKNKSDFTPSVLPTSLSASSLQSQTPLECHDEVLSSQGVPEVDKAAGIYRLCDFTESDFDNQSTLYVALINEADKWTQLEDSCLLEWLELRARVVGTHPLNMTLEQVISPTDAVGVLHSCGYVSSESDYCIGSLSTGSSSTLTATAFIRRFEPLLSKSLISIRLRSLLLLHLNDTLSPLLNVVYDPSGVDDDEGINIPYDLMSPLNTTILANRHLILLEVKFSYGFRLGWSTAMSQSMLDGGANSVTSMFQKKKAILERKHLSSYQDTSPVTRTSVDDDISFSACPSELPLLPYRSFPPRGNSANFNLKTTEDSTLSNICTFNLLNNPLHPLSFNAGVNTKTRVTSSSQTKPSVVEGTTLDRLSVYYFEDATSCFLNWSTSSVVTSSASTPTAASSVPTQLPVSSTNNILGLPVINMFVVEQQRLHRGVLENSKKYQLQQVFEDDYRWHLLSNFQSSLLGQFMQTLERLNVQQLMSSKPPAGAAASTDSDPANAPLENATVFSQVAPQGPWHGVLRSVFRAGMFWDDHMSPSSRPVSIYVHFLPQQYDGMKKEHRMSKKDRVNGSVDSACSGTTLTPRQAPAQNSSFHNHTPHYDTIPESDASSPSDKIFDDKKEKEKAEILRSLSLPPPPTGQQVPGASQLAMSRLQRTIHLLQANFSKLVDGTPTAVVSPWTSLQMYIVEAVSEVQPLLASSLLSNEENFYFMDVSELDLLARNDVLCQFLAKHAKISDTIQESTGSSSLAGVINLHLHVMHSLGVLLGVALRHGISTNIRMSNYFWRLLSRASVSPYFCTPEFGNETTHKAVDGKPGQRLQELYSGVRESCGRALRHGIVSIIPEGFLNLLQEGELRVLLSGGGSSCVELLRSVASYTKPVLASDMHIEMFWIAFNDLPPTAVNRFLHCLWGSARIEKDNTGVMFPEELFYWKQTPTVLGKFIFADIPTQTTASPEPNNSNNLLGETDNRIHNGTQLVDSQLIYISDHHVVHLPRYSNLDLMRAKLKDFIDSL